jgi:hypothetical protein
MSNILINRYLTTINFIIVAYFLSIYFLYLYKIDTTLIGVLRELLTIPFLIAQIVFLIIGIRYIIKNNSKNYLTILSVIALMFSTIFTIGSFF